MSTFLKFSVVLVILCLTACQKRTLQVNSEVSSSRMSQIHKGEITFMKGYIPFEEFTEADILSSFDYDDSANLNIRIFLDQPLIDHLAELAPALSPQELCDNGNYQFRFYVDGNQVYEENLNFGAGSCEQKKSNTVISVPLASTENEDSWGRYLWYRFLFRGSGDAALQIKGHHVLKIEVRPYVGSPSLKVGNVIARGEVNLNVVKPVASPEDIAIQEVQPLSGWPISNDHFDQRKIESLNKKIAEKDFREIQSIVVIKDGHLLLEEYFNGATRATLHNTRSVGKTFASTVMGIALDEGYISNINEPLSTFYKLENFENYSVQKDKVTLKSLLMMSSGFDGNDDDYDSPGNEEYMYPTDDWVKFALDLKMDKTKTLEKDWAYFTAGVVVLGDILNNTVPEGLDKYADKKLFEPLGIRNYKWQYTPTNVPNTAGGISLRALDFAKYGQLYKNGGTWNGERILSKEWVSSSLAKQIKRPSYNPGFYGYLFWNDTYTIQDKQYEVAYCSGNGGNKIFVFKDLPLVVVITATAYGRPYAHPQVDKIMEEYILPAVIIE